MFCDKHNAVGFGQATCQICELEKQMASIEHAAHMPEDWGHGLPSWINQELYASYIGAKVSPHIMELIESGRLVFPDSPTSKALDELRESLRIAYQMADMLSNGNEALRIERDEWKRRVTMAQDDDKSFYDVSLVDVEA